MQTSYDALRNATNYGYDDAGRRTSLTDAMQKLTTFGYDNVGNQTSVLDANQHQTQFVYDKLGRKTQTVYPDQTTDTTHYDSLGRVDYKLDQASVRTDYGYEGDGRLTSVTQYLNFGQANQQALVTQYGYDEVGNRTSQTDANQHTTTYGYDNLGRRTSRKLPAGQSESYSYDLAGNLKTKVDFNGKTTTYAYDTNNRLLSKTPDPSFSAQPVSFTYYNNGLRKTMVDPSGTTSYVYDNRNRLQTKQTPEGTLNYTYDNAGDLLTLASGNANGASDTYTYDALNRLSTVVDASGTTTYAYDNVGNLQSFAYPNGVTTAYTYDSLNRLKQMGAGKNGTLQANYVYTLGAAGNRLTVAELSGRTVNYGYDSLYRLTSEAITNDPNNHNNTTQYQYDNVGNRQQLIMNGTTANVYSYDADDRLGSDQYDPNGNTVSSAGTTSTYDFENHLVSKGGLTIVYDGDGNRVSETVAGVTTQYLVDTQNPTGYAQVVDELQNGSVVKSYSYGLERISQRPTANGQGPSFYGFDGHGSVRFLTDSTGAVTDTYDYDAFGNLVNSTGSTPNNYLFAGEQYDPALGLYYNRARYLNTTTGRFWSMDSYEGDPSAPTSLHKYLYDGSDPVNHRDPSGNDFDLGSTLAASAGGTTIFGMSVIQSAIVIHAVTGGLFAASIAGFGAALEGKSPDQIESATGNVLNITLGALTAIGGSVAVASKLGAYALAVISLGGGGWKAYSEYKQGNSAAAVYYGALGTLGGVLSAAVPYLRGSTQTPPTVVLKGPVPNVVPTNLSEQLALEEAEANAEDVIITNLADAPRLEANYGSGQWVKAQWVHYSPSGTYTQTEPGGPIITPEGSNYTVHYFINLITGERVEFKFTNTP